MSLSDDPLKNASPKTRQRYEEALARRRSKEQSFHRASPFVVARRVEPSVPVESPDEGHAWAHEPPAPPEHFMRESQVHGSFPSRIQGSEQQSWASWEYSPQEWALFEDVDWQPVRHTYWLLFGLCFPFFGDLLLMIWFSIALLPQPAFERFPLLPFVFPLSFVLILLLSLIPIILLSSYSYLYGQAKIRHKVRLLDRPHRVTIAKQGVWEAGAYIPFDVLNKVEMTTQPTVLHFRREKSLVATRNAPRYNTFHVPVPYGYEDEALSIVQRLRVEVIAEREQMLQRALNPPEPV